MFEIKGVDITQEKDGGILKEIDEEGTGDDCPLLGQTVKFHYTGYTLDGKQFATSHEEKNEPASMVIGRSNKMPGFDIALMSMKRGEKATFIVDSKYSSDSNNSNDHDGIDANNESTDKQIVKETIVLKLELIDFFSEDISYVNDKSVLRRVLVEGTGYETPFKKASVEVRLKGTYQGTVFDERDVDFDINEGEDYGIIEGVEFALQQFRVGETAILDIVGRRAFGPNGYPKFNIPPNADVQYEVTLKHLRNYKDARTMKINERIEEAEYAKNKGTSFFKKNDFIGALNKYSRVVDILHDQAFPTPEEQEKAKQLIIAGHLNVAACYLKLNEFIMARDACENVLKIERSNEKGYFRMGTAYAGLFEYEKAVICFNRVLEINPNNKEAQNQINLIHKKVKEYNQREKKLYSKMLNNISDECK